MNKWFSATCDRHGHLITLGGLSTATNALLAPPTAEQVELVPPVAASNQKDLKQPTSLDALFRTGVQGQPIRRILIPVDANHARLSDLKPILKLARHCDAQVTLLHCYTTPPSFECAEGSSALMEVTLHRNMVRARLFELCSHVKKFFGKCSCQFTFGSPPTEILRASERLNADLIAVPLSLDFLSHCWNTKGILDKLVRPANCPVLGFPSAI